MNKSKSVSVGVDAVVKIPINIHGKELRWSKKPPDEQGWWWIIFPLCDPEIAQVISDGKYFLIFYNHHSYTFENESDSKYLSDCLWAGPICPPI